MMSNLRYFKLIDKDGFIASHPSNKRMIKGVESGVLSGDIDDDGDFIGMIDSHVVCIFPGEMKYFKEVFPADHYATDTKAVVNHLSGKDLDAKIKAQDEQIKQLESENEQLRAENERLEFELLECYGVSNEL